MKTTLAIRRRLNTIYGQLNPLMMMHFKANKYKTKRARQKYELTKGQRGRLTELCAQFAKYNERLEDTCKRK